MGFEDGLGRWEARQAGQRLGGEGAAGLGPAQGQGLRPSRKPPLCPVELGPSLSGLSRMLVLTRVNQLRTVISTSYPRPPCDPNAAARHLLKWTHGWRA